MTAFWVCLFLSFALLTIVGIPLYRIADALETHNRWLAKIATDINVQTQIANIKRG